MGVTWDFKACKFRHLVTGRTLDLVCTPDSWYHPDLKVILAAMATLGRQDCLLSPGDIDQLPNLGTLGRDVVRTSRGPKFVVHPTTTSVHFALKKSHHSVRIEPTVIHAKLSLLLNVTVEWNSPVNSAVVEKARSVHQRPIGFGE